MPKMQGRSSARVSASTLKSAKATRVVPADRSGRAQAAKKQVKTIRFTTGK